MKNEQHEASENEWHVVSDNDVHEEKQWVGVMLGSGLGG